MFSAARKARIIIFLVFSPAGRGFIIVSLMFFRSAEGNFILIIKFAAAAAGRIILLSRKRTIPRKRFRGSERGGAQVPLKTPLILRHAPLRAQCRREHN